MRTLWSIAQHDLRLALQGWRSWLLLLVLPLATVYLAGLGAREFARAAMPTMRVDVLDQDHSTASAAFAVALAQANTDLTICSAASNAEACRLPQTPLTLALARERLQDRITVALVTIPSGFGAALDAGEPVTLSLEPGLDLAQREIAYGAVQSAAIRTGGPSVAAQLSTQLAQQAGVEADASFVDDRLDDARAAWGPPQPVTVQAQLLGKDERILLGAQASQNGFKVSTLSVAVMFVMITVMGLTQSLAEERMTGVLRRLEMLPVKQIQILAGKLLAISLLGSLQFALVLAFGELLGVGLSRAGLPAILLGLTFVAATTSMALTLGALARTAAQADALATLAWVVLTPLGGGWWPLTYVPAWLRAIGHLSPVAWCLDGLQALVFYEGGWSDVLPACGVLLALAAVFLGLGVSILDYRSARRVAANRRPR